MMIQKVNTRGLNYAYRSKMKIVCGTDAGSTPRTSPQVNELIYYVQKAGFSPLDAIRTAPVTAAEMLKLNELGSLQAGFLADILLYKGNPLKNILVLKNIEFVMKNGKIYKEPK